MNTKHSTAPVTDTRPRLLDLFCGAGGAAMGYYRAGFDVVGVDIKPQPRYPFPFIQGDAIDVLTRMLKGEKFLASDGRWYGIEDFDVIHTSPPCQAYSITKSIHGNEYPDLVAITRAALQATGKPWIIENVVGAPLFSPLMLCGSMFEGLRVYRHRLFESYPRVWFAPASCHHSFVMPASKGQYHELNGTNFITCVGHNFKARDGRIAMGIDWMTRTELSQAIPPAYTEYIGRQLLQALNHESQA